MVKKDILSTIRNVIFCLIAIAMSSATSEMCLTASDYYFSEAREAFDTPFWYHSVRFLTPIICIGATILVFYYFDNLDLFNKRNYFNDYLCKGNKSPLLSRYQYLIPTVISLLFGLFAFTPSLSFALDELIPSVSLLVSRILSVIIFAAIRLIQLHLLQSKWDLELDQPIFVQKAAFRHSGDMDSFTPMKLILKPIGFSIIYFGVSFLFCRFLLQAVYAVIIIAKELWWIAIPILLIAILIPFSISAIHALKARGKLLRRLKRLERQGYAKIKYDGNKYLSAIFPKMIFSFSLEDLRGKKYNATVISCGKLNAPIYFRENEFLIERSMRLNNGALIARGGRFAQIVDVNELGEGENPTNALMGYYIVLPLDFSSVEGERTVIINPIPSKIFVMNNEKAKRIDTGERIFGYTVYNTTGFCNMIERDND